METTELVRSDSYFQISGWMINKLKLKGVELQVFAIIYGFSQDGRSKFMGSTKYLMAWTGSSRNTVMKAIQSLVEKEYIVKETEEISNVKFNRYRVNLDTLNRIYDDENCNKKPIDTPCQKLMTPPVKNCTPPCQKLGTDNIENNIDIYTSTPKGNEEENNNIFTGKTEGSHRTPRKRSEVRDFYSNNIHPLASPIEAEKLDDLEERYGEDWVIAAITEAVENNARSLRYIEAVLKAWAEKGRKNTGYRKKPPKQEEVEEDDDDDLYRFLMSGGKDG